MLALRLCGRFFSDDGDTSDFKLTHYLFFGQYSPAKLEDSKMEEVLVVAQRRGNKMSNM
jgi:hypothetical protein